MADILLLSNETIDKIAAGEVVERPVNVCKELVENSIDAGATRINVEIKGGGIDLIRVTDDGKGIPATQCEKAFLRHATSKLRKIEDLNDLASLGFRGEALSSISAVSKTELITKTKDNLLGIHFVVEGGSITDNSEIGAPNGTTILVRQLFYNTPARKKFLYSSTKEAASIEELMEKFALSNPDISFSLLINGKTKLQTSGNGDLKDVIYSIFGKDIYKSLIPVYYENSGLKISGFMAKPELSYQSRNGEIYFVNGRFIKSKVIKTAIEEGFQGFLMQHRFPFIVFNMEVDAGSVDVNVHPQKLDVRFSDNQLISDSIIKAIRESIKNVEIIPEATLSDINDSYIEEDKNFSFIDFSKYEHVKDNIQNTIENSLNIIKVNEIKDDLKAPEPFEEKRIIEQKLEMPNINNFQDETLFSKKLLSEEALKDYRIIGQVFDTYWLVTLDDDLYIVDQHAAHEKVNYENFLSEYLNEEGAYAQKLISPIALTLSPSEKNLLISYFDIFTKIGFEIEDFGENSFAIRSVPTNLFGVSVEELFHSLLNELNEKDINYTPEVVLSKLASKACKASVKAGMKISYNEMESLMKQLMNLKNPYNCPHGRPTLIKITKTELEKKFKRII